MCAHPVVLDASQSPWPIASADGIICINMVHISPWDARLGFDQGRGRDTSSDSAVLSLWPIQTRRIRNDPEQPSVRPKPSRSQPDLGSARPRSGRNDRAIRRILCSDNYRDARKQSERGVPPDLIETVHQPQANDRPEQPKFSDTLDRTEASRTIVGVGLFNLGLGVHDKRTARDDRLMQWTTGIEQSPQGFVLRSNRHL